MDNAFVLSGIWVEDVAKGEGHATGHVKVWIHVLIFDSGSPKQKNLPIAIRLV